MKQFSYIDKSFATGILPTSNTPLSSLPVGSNIILLPTGSEEREVLGVGSFPVAILPSCQDMEAIAL